VDNGIAYVHSDFYNGAAGTAQCERLTAAIKEVGGREDVKAVLLMGGEHSYGNGINLNTIEASDDPEKARTIYANDCHSNTFQSVISQSLSQSVSSPASSASTLKKSFRR